MTKPLFSIGADQISSGLFPDVDGKNAPVWEDGRNVRFEPGAVKPSAGHRLFLKQGEDPILGMKGTRVSGVPTLFFGTGSKIYKAVESGTVTEVGTGFTPARWSFIRWGNWVLATNNKEQLQIWKGTSFGNAAGTSFTRAKVLFKVKEYAVVCNTNVDEAEIVWSDLDNPEVWSPTATNQAGDLRLRDLNGPLTAGVSFRDAGFIFSQDSMYIMQFVGSPYIFSVNKALEGIGAVGPQAVCTTGDSMYGLGPEGVWQSDGYSMRYIDAGVHDFIYENITRTHLDNVVLWHDILAKSIVVYYPDLDSEYPNVGLIYNYALGAWSMTTHAWSAAEARTVFPKPVLGSVVGELYFQDEYIPPSGAENDGQGKLTIREQYSGLLGCGVEGCGRHGFGGGVKFYG